MIIQFTIGNFLSFKEQSTLSLVASALKEIQVPAEDIIFNVGTSGLSLMKSAVVYGANASGKSNFIKALEFFKWYVINSSKDIQAGERVNIESFRLNSLTANEPSYFEAIFCDEDNQYRYGFEADIEIFRPLFSKERFPKLTYLGIVNSEEQDKIVEMFLESDILPQLETMDVSAGTLKDEGAQLLLDNMDKIAHLKFINMRYNYLSKEMKKQLQSLPMKIDIAETEEADEYDGELWYYPMITE
ncbi:MAG: AAA family ATPase [Bacteroides ovatus]|nr:AAA family ATPase [Bacteroides ovatus]